jgi:uncharacterized protein
MQSESLPAPTLPPPAVPGPPWSARDAWISVGLLCLVVVGDVAFDLIARRTVYFQTFGASTTELAFILPTLVILAWRRASPASLGFRKFEWRAMQFGCGALVAAYLIALINNGILVALHLHTQGADVIRLFQETKTPLDLACAAVVIAPFVEEMFFRGVLFQALRQSMGWNKAAVLASLVFALFHLDPAALIPTFALGYAFAYVYNRTNSIWPGILLHFSVNFFGVALVFASSHLVH